jgi:serine/threonine protein kinase
LRFLSKLLELEPDKRITASAAIDHAFFSDIRREISIPGSKLVRYKDEDFAFESTSALTVEDLRRELYYEANRYHPEESFTTPSPMQTPEVIPEIDEKSNQPTTLNQISSKDSRKIRLTQKPLTNFWSGIADMFRTIKPSSGEPPHGVSNNALSRHHDFSGVDHEESKVQSRTETDGGTEMDVVTYRKYA